MSVLVPPSPEARVSVCVPVSQHPGQRLLSEQTHLPTSGPLRPCSCCLNNSSPDPTSPPPGVGPRTPRQAATLPTPERYLALPAHTPGAGGLPALFQLAQSIARGPADAQWSQRRGQKLVQNEPWGWEREREGRCHFGPAGNVAGETKATGADPQWNVTGSGLRGCQYTDHHK